MKRISIIAVLIAVLLSACTSRQSVYEKAIADYVQTDKRGTWTDLKFQVLSLEVSERTIADSLNLLKTEFEKLRDEQITSQQKTLNYFQGLLKDNQAAKYAKQAVNDQLNKSIISTKARIDSLRNLPATYADRFKGRNPAEVAAMVVKCHYSYALPETTTAKERTDTFVLSPDGKKVIGKVVQTGD